MKLIVAGSRTFTDYQHLCQVLAPDRHRITQVLTGGARGAELLAYRWAWKHAVKHQLFRADWERFGKAAGVRRNHQMAQAGDVLVVLGHTTSPGTAHLIQCMRALGKPVVLIRVQWFSQKSGGDSAVRSEFVIAGLLFHPSRVKSELLHKYIEQALVELTLFPTCHREAVWRLTLLHTQVRSAHEIERGQ